MWSACTVRLFKTGREEGEFRHSIKHMKVASPLPPPLAHPLCSHMPRPYYMYEFQNRLFIIVRRKPYPGRYFKDLFVIVVVIMFVLYH